jgi:hypothetical protein
MFSNASTRLLFTRFALDLGRAFHDFDRTAELGQYAIAHEFYDSPAVPFDRGRDELPASSALMSRP